MHSSVIKLVVDRVSEILASEDPFLTKHDTVCMCNDLLQFLAEQAAKSPMFACAIWHYLLDKGYQIGNCTKHDLFESHFHETLVSMTDQKRVMLRKISEKLFLRTHPIPALQRT